MLDDAVARALAQLLDRPTGFRHADDGHVERVVPHHVPAAQGRSSCRRGLRWRRRTRMRPSELPSIPLLRFVAARAITRHLNACPTLLDTSAPSYSPGFGERVGARADNLPNQFIRTAAVKVVGDDEHPMNQPANTLSRHSLCIRARFHGLLKSSIDVSFVSGHDFTAC